MRANDYDSVYWAARSANVRFALPGSSAPRREEHASPYCSRKSRDGPILPSPFTPLTVWAPIATGQMLADIPHPSLHLPVA